MNDWTEKQTQEFNNAFVSERDVKWSTNVNHLLSVEMWGRDVSEWGKGGAQTLKQKEAEWNSAVIPVTFSTPALFRPFEYFFARKAKTEGAKEHTKPLALVEGFLHSRTGGTVAKTNATAILHSTGLDPVVTAYVL